MTKVINQVVILVLAAVSSTLAVAQDGNPPARGNAGGRGGAGPGTALAGQMLSQGDRNGDAKLTRDEFAALADEWFDQLDPDHVGRLGQEEFLGRFGSISSAAQGSGARGGRGVAGAGVALGFFTAADADDDALLTRSEFKRAFEKWFSEWDTDKSGALDQSKLVAGLNRTLPRTNLTNTAGRESQDRIPGLPLPPPSPALPPKEAIKTIHLVDGFNLELAASEPLIEDPIVLSFDEDGRAFVVEMRNFMLDIDRSHERDPIGRISLLEDANRDGHFEKSKVFVDGLILPRAVAAVAGGVLYVSDYKLYLARDTDGDGKADHTELLDADYGRGNVEHAPNGLFRAMDNWMYNGESPYRYRLVNGILVKQRTEVRGQWGMTQDNYGRLLYDVNNSQLLGDFTPPNYMGRNSHYQTSAGLNLFVATDQRVFPLRMNTGINRGYSPDVLDSAGKAFVFASSCSPMVYRGDNYPAEFVGNAFVCDPAVNLIKRNLVFDQNLTLSSKFAYDDREFIASTDERFRPVSLYNGPDGTLWMVDMYRGISQYGQFMTSYLRRETLERGLDKGIHFGRIYRIVSTKKSPARFPRLSRESSGSLVGRLSDANGWTRDTAQRLLVERGDRSVAPALVRLVSNGKNNPLGRIHALWTLEGLFVSVPEELAVAIAPSTNLIRLLSADPGIELEAPSLPQNVLDACLKTIKDPNPKIQVAAIRVAESLTAGSPANQRVLLQELARLKTGAPEAVLFQAALTAGNLAKPEALPLLARIAAEEAEHLLIREAVVSGLQQWELQILQFLLADPQWTVQQPGRSALLQALASAIIKERQPTKIEVLLRLAASQNPDQAWRRRSLLEGIAANVQVRNTRPIPFTAAPAAIEILAKADDPQTRQQGERIKALFSWPGHQSAETTQSAAAPLTSGEALLIAEGKNLFQQVCSGCHGLAGQGLKPMAPPLVNSDWVLGSESRLIRMLLHGISGPIKVNGTTYQPPNILPEMPALAVLEDAQIAAILSYIRRDWGHEAAPVMPAQVTGIRSETQNRQKAWNEEQLLQVK